MDEKESWETSPLKYLPSSHVKTEMFTNPTLPSPSTKILFAHNWRSRRGGKIKYRGASVYLAPRTFNPLVYFFFHAFYRSIFTHHRAPKAGIYQSVEHLLYSRARGCKPSLVGTSHGECLRGLRSYERFHTLRRRALCDGHSMPRRKIYDIAICATIYYKIAVSDIHPPSRSIATIFLPFLPPSSPRITRLRIFGIVSLSCTRFIYLFFCRQLS